MTLNVHHKSPLLSPPFPPGRLWQERTVIVKREENGFGFTLTQEMPVFVDKVFNGSSAQKAGIHPKDRIIKVS